MSTRGVRENRAKTGWRDLEHSTPRGRAQSLPWGPPPVAQRHNRLEDPRFSEGASTGLGRTETSKPEKEHTHRQERRTKPP